MSVTENIETYDQPCITDAGSLYRSLPPVYVGNFVMSKAMAATMPVDLDGIYQPCIEVLQADPEKARVFAERFGKLSVLVGLDNQLTGFQLMREGSFAPKNTTPITTSRLRKPSQLFVGGANDARYAYVLCDEQETTAELALIQALHMLDYAIVSDQFDGSMPIVVRMEADAMAELQAKNPEVLIRTYGNVRQLANAPYILGTVLPTSVLESSDVEYSLFDVAEKAADIQLVPDPHAREPATMIGITTAKKPHIGHGFLMLKAIAQAGKNGTVLVELNDRGPRVAAAVAALAAKQCCSFERAASDIADAEVSPSAIEAAYRSRAKFDPQQLPADFALTANNAYYARLIERLAPEGVQLRPIANSSKAMKALGNMLLSNANALRLFGDSGMTLLGDGISVVVQERQEITMLGVIGSLAAGYDLTIVDSPAPLDRQQLRAFADSGIGVMQQEGMGVSVDFGVASGTRGEAPTIDELLSQLDCSDSEALLPVLRSLLSNAVFIAGDGKSLNPNFSSAAVMVDKIRQLYEDETYDLDSMFEPMKFRKIGRDLGRSLTPYIDQELFPAKGKVSTDEIKALVACLPALAQEFASSLLRYCESSTSSSVVPRSYLAQNDVNLINKIRTGDMTTVLKLFSQSLPINPQIGEQAMQGMLGEILSKMGYDSGDMPAVVEQIVNTGEIYVLE